VVRDVLKEGFKKNISDKKEIFLSRVFSVTVGIISALIALKPPDLILVIMAFSWAVIASTNFWPLLFGIYWKRANKAGALSSMICGAAASLIWSVLKNPWGIHGYIAGIVVGFIVIVFVTLCTSDKEVKNK
jgi:Na+(H+)/acetate symporter ActP